MNKMIEYIVYWQWCDMIVSIRYVPIQSAGVMYIGML